MSDLDDRLSLLESEIERRLGERFAALRDEFERLRMESDRRWEGFLSRFDQDFHGIVPPELLLPPPAPVPEPQAAPPGPTKGAIPIAAVRALDGAGNQVETLHRFLDLCRDHASRAALLIAKGGGLGVWKAVGYAEHGGDDDAVRRVSLPADGDLARVLAGTPVRLEQGNAISPRLLSGDASSAILVPMVVKEKISGAVYADAGAEELDRFDPEAIALLTFLAGLAVDRLASRKLKPAPALLDPALSEPPLPEAEPAQPEREREPEHYFHEERASAPAPAPPPAAEPPSPPPPPRPAEPAPRRFEAPEPPPSVSWKPVAVEPVEEAERSASAIDFEPEPPGGAAHPPDFAADTPAAPSLGTRRLAGPLAPVVESDERRDEARRFARLLVSEIKLYNERAVIEGREQGNLYARLKEDIDRSRQMYDDRIPEDVRSSSNFFYEELVRVLADGRAEALGM